MPDTILLFCLLFRLICYIIIDFRFAVMRELVNKHFEEHKVVIDSLQNDSCEKIIQIAGEIVLALRSKKNHFLVW